MANSIAKNKKTWCIVGICVSALLILLAFCGRYFDGFLCKLGNFWLGSFGIAFYGIAVAVIVGCSFALAGKRIALPAKYIVHSILAFVVIVLLVHIIPTFFYGIADVSYSDYVKNVYHYYDSSTMGIPTFGGVVFGSIAYLLSSVLSIWGTLIICLLLLTWNVIVLGGFFYSYFTGKIAISNPDTKTESIVDEGTPTSHFTFDPVDDQRKKAMELLFNQESTIHPEEVSSTPATTHFDFAPQSQIERTPANPVREPTAEEILFGSNGGQSASSFFGRTDTESQPRPTEPTPQPPKDDFSVQGFCSTDEPSRKESSVTDDWLIDSAPSAEESAPKLSRSDISAKEDDTVYQADNFDSDKVSFGTPFVQQSTSNTEPTAINADDFWKQAEQSQNNYSDESLSSDGEIDVVDAVASENVQVDAVEKVAPDTTQYQEEVEESPDDIVAVETVTPTEGGLQMGFDFRTKEEIKRAQEKIHHFAPYVAPEIELLDDTTVFVDQDQGERRRNVNAIIDKLHVFGVDVQFDSAIVGPSVTQYQFNVVSKTRMGDFARYSEDIKACVESESSVRIEAPVAGTNKVGVEVENKHKTAVKLRTLLESDTFKNAKGDLVFAIGQRITGEIIVKDLAQMPHLLVAGTTGSGKSVCLNCLIVSLMYRYGPEYVRFLMVDPKLVELSRYNGIPHMLTAETITKVGDALAGMDYLIKEMESRYALFKQKRVGNIAEYNKYITSKLEARLPYLVFIVDELSDLMINSKAAFEAKFLSLAQKARAAGIHLVLATQRPDVKTITGTIKANLPSRIALKVASQFDSNTIIGKGGADKLLGHGDLLLMTSDSADLVRIQGAYVSNEEIKRIVESAIECNERYYDPAVSDQIFVKETVDDSSDESEMDKDEKLDPHCKRALRYWLESNAGKASISSLTRSLGVGFNRAGRIYAQLQELKCIEKPLASEPSSKPVKVLVTLEDLDTLFPDMEG